MWEMWVWSLGREGALENRMVTHSSIIGASLVAQMVKKKKKKSAMWDHHAMVSQITVLGIMGCEIMGALPSNTAYYVNWNYLVSVYIQMTGEWAKEWAGDSKVW